MTTTDQAAEPAQPDDSFRPLRLAVFAAAAVAVLLGSAERAAGQQSCADFCIDTYHLRTGSPKKDFRNMQVCFKICERRCFGTDNVCLAPSTVPGNTPVTRCRCPDGSCPPPGEQCCPDSPCAEESCSPTGCCPDEEFWVEEAGVCCSRWKWCPQSNECCDQSEFCGVSGCGPCVPSCEADDWPYPVACCPDGTCQPGTGCCPFTADDGADIAGFFGNRQKPNCCRSKRSTAFSCPADLACCTTTDSSGSPGECTPFQCV